MTIEERLQRLEDDRAIRDLKARYLRACDMKQPDIVRDTLLPEARVIYEGFPECDNREQFVEIYRQFGCVDGIYDVHHGANGLIEFESAEKASGKWSLTFINVNLAQRTVMNLGVEYEDIYVKRGGRWWIAETRSWKKLALVESVDADGKPTIVALGEASGLFGDG